MLREPASKLPVFDRMATRSRVALSDLYPTPTDNSLLAVLEEFIVMNHVLLLAFISVSVADIWCTVAPAVAGMTFTCVDHAVRVTVGAARITVVEPTYPDVSRPPLSPICKPMVLPPFEPSRHETVICFTPDGIDVSETEAPEVVAVSVPRVRPPPPAASVSYTHLTLPTNREV